MSVALDFSEMFTGTGKAADSERHEDGDRSVEDSSNEEAPTEPVNDPVWIMDQLTQCNVSLTEEQLKDPSVSAAIVALLAEKSRVYSQNKKMMDDCSKLRSQLGASMREKESLNEQIAVLNQDVRVSKNRISALQTEQRDLRNHWLEEKTDLESKVFHSNTLSTQWQASMRKKEKDYDKLQVQLAKMVRESNKANKAQSIIQVSKPLKANSSQLSATERSELNAFNLREAEIANIRGAMVALEKENSFLKKTIEDVAASIEGQVSAAVDACRAECNEELTTAQNAATEAAEALVENEKQLEESVAAMAAAKAAAASASATAVQPSVSSPLPTTPASKAGSIIQAYLTNTPGARPRSVMKEVLRTDQKRQNDSFVEIQDQLKEALAVIKEQDRLIKQALLRKLPVSEDEEDEEEERQGTPSSGTPAAKASSDYYPESAIKDIMQGGKRGVHGAALNKENASNAEMMSPKTSFSAWEDELFAGVSPYTQNLLAESGVTGAAGAATVLHRDFE